MSIENLTWGGVIKCIGILSLICQIGGSMLTLAGCQVNRSLNCPDLLPVPHLPQAFQRTRKLSTKLSTTSFCRVWMWPSLHSYVFSKFGPQGDLILPFISSKIWWGKIGIGKLSLKVLFILIIKNREWRKIINISQSHFFRKGKTHLSWFMECRIQRSYILEEATISLPITYHRKWPIKDTEGRERLFRYGD